MGRIVVGVDGSDQSLAALRWACEEARLRGDSLDVISAWSLPTMGFDGSSAEVVDALEGAAEEAVRVAREQLAQVAPELPAETNAVHGHPARVLVERALGADMLVVGSRGLGGFRSLLLGSVSNECSMHSPSPIVIVRPSHDQGGAA